MIALFGISNDLEFGHWRFEGRPIGLCGVDLKPGPLTFAWPVSQPNEPNG
jgi:hypothetical protein